MSPAKKEDALQKRLSRLPKVDEVLGQPVLRAWRGSPLATPAVREVLGRIRKEVREGGGEVPAAGEVAGEAKARLERRTAPRLRRVINGTGIVIHTNLGRAPLGERQKEALLEAASGYGSLEYDLGSGKRGSRHHLVTHLLTALTGAEDALVVNNNAAALMLALSALAPRKQVLVSRGQLVEIGGSFRIPDICRASGAKMVEVGTTNRTRIGDYERSIDEVKTALLLRVHPSNFRIEGFTESVTLEQLVELGRSRGLAVVDDLGSGALLDLSANTPLPREPLVAESVAAGADVVTFSGDKLLGGPQAGIAVGRAAAIEKMRRHPLMRAVRPGKLTFAALDATLRAYLHPDSIAEELPVWRMLEATPAELQSWGGPLVREVAAAAERAGLTVSLEESRAAAGGGSLPGSELPSVALAFRGSGGSLTFLQRRLREGAPPVIGYLQEESLRLDLRTMMLEDRAELGTTLNDALSELSS